MRDVQRQRVYDAEAQVGWQLAAAARGARIVEVAGSRLALPLETRFGSFAAVQGYVEALQGGSVFAARCPRATRVPLVVRRRAGDRAAHYEPPATIALHDDAASLRELVVLHELAHHGQAHDLSPEPAHGPGFAALLVALVGEAMGPEVALLLTAAYAEHKVDCAPGRGAAA